MGIWSGLWRGKEKLGNKEQRLGCNENETLQTLQGILISCEHLKSLWKGQTLHCILKLTSQLHR